MTGAPVVVACVLHPYNHTYPLMVRTSHPVNGHRLLRAMTSHPQVATDHIKLARTRPGCVLFTLLPEPARTPSSTAYKSPPFSQTLRSSSTPLRITFSTNRTLHHISSAFIIITPCLMTCQPCLTPSNLISSLSNLVSSPSILVSVLHPTLPIQAIYRSRLSGYSSDVPGHFIIASIFSGFEHNMTLLRPH
jgi:hypothetical protein